MPKRYTDRKGRILVDQPTNEPTPKTKAAGIGGLIVTILLGAADLLDVIDVSGSTIGAAAAAGLLAFANAYRTRERA